jgi:hypothetical protein
MKGPFRSESIPDDSYECHGCHNKDIQGHEDIEHSNLRHSKLCTTIKNGIAKFLSLY